MVVYVCIGGVHVTVIVLGWHVEDEGIDVVVFNELVQRWPCSRACAKAEMPSKAAILIADTIAKFPPNGSRRNNDSGLQLRSWRRTNECEQKSGTYFCRV